MRHQYTGIVLTILISGTVLLSHSVAQEEKEDPAMDKLQKLLEEKETPDEASSRDDSSDSPDIEEANRELHGGESPGDRERKKPGEVLDKIIDEMDTAARSLETNVQKLRKIKGMLEELNLDKDGTSSASKKQQKILRRLEKLFDESTENQKNVSEQLQELISFKDQLASVKSSQKKSISNIEKLLKIARKRSKSSKSGSGKRRKKKKKQGQKKQAQGKQKKKQQKKPSRQRRNKNQPADKPYEASSEKPDTVKTYSSGDASRWGNLPDYVRKEIIQRQNEEFVPEYSERLRNYYKKLGEDSSSE